MVGGRDDEGVEVRCRRCRHLLAHAGDRARIAGGHRHQFANPAGVVYDIACYERAPGCIAAGEASDEASWFSDTTWQRAFCRGCSRHVGWLFRSKSRWFHALITDRVDSPVPPSH